MTTPKLSNSVRFLVFTSLAIFGLSLNFENQLTAATTQASTQDDPGSVAPEKSFVVNASKDGPVHENNTETKTQMKTPEDMLMVFVRRPELQKPVKQLQERYNELAKMEFQLESVQDRCVGGDFFEENLHQEMANKFATAVDRDKKEIVSISKVVTRAKAALKGGTEAIDDFIWILNQRNKLPGINPELPSQPALERFIQSQNQRKIDLQSKVDQDLIHVELHNSEAKRLNGMKDEIQVLKEKIAQLFVGIEGDSIKVLDALDKVENSEKLLMQWKAALALEQHRIANQLREIRKTARTDLEFYKNRMDQNSKGIIFLKQRLQETTSTRAKALEANGKGGRAMEDFVWLEIQRGQIAGADSSQPVAEKAKTILRRYLLLQEQVLEDAKSSYELHLRAFQKAQMEFDRLAKLERRKKSLASKLGLIEKQQAEILKWL